MTVRNWDAALAAAARDRAERPEIREEILQAYRSRSAPGLTPLAAWRGLSGSRYTVAIHPLTLDAAREAGPHVLIAVNRDDAGVASIVDLGSGLWLGEAAELVWRALRAGANELHVHRLADTAAERVAIVGDLTAPVARAA